LIFVGEDSKKKGDKGNSFWSGRLPSLDKQKIRLGNECNESGRAVIRTLRGRGQGDRGSFCVGQMGEKKSGPKGGESRIRGKP